MCLSSVEEVSVGSDVADTAAAAVVVAVAFVFHGVDGGGSVRVRTHAFFLVSCPLGTHPT